MTSEASVDISIIPALADIGKCDKKFNPEKCAALFGICAANTVNVNLLALLEGSMEIKKLLVLLGAALKMAAADVEEKVTVMSKRLGEYIVAKQVTTDPRLITVNELVMWEVERGVEKKNDKTYVSAARSLVRLCWFLDFITALLKVLLPGALLGEGVDIPADTPADGMASLSDAAKFAYDAALAPHHPWLLRKTVSAGLLMLPNKSNFFASIAGGSAVEEVPARLAAFRRQVDPVKEALWNFLKTNNLQDLP